MGLKYYSAVFMWSLLFEIRFQNNLRIAQMLNKFNKTNSYCLLSSSCFCLNFILQLDFYSIGIEIWQASGR